MHVQMRSQKIANHLTLVRRQIVQNDVGLSRRRPFDHLYEELHKLLDGGILRRSRRVAAAITFSCPSLNKPLRNVSPSVAGQSSIPARSVECSSFCRACSMTVMIAPLLFSTLTIGMMPAYLICESAEADRKTMVDSSCNYLGRCSRVLQWT